MLFSQVSTRPYPNQRAENERYCPTDPVDRSFDEAKKNQAPLKHLQELGGWATMDMVMRYAHLAPGHLAQYAERSALGPAPEPEVAQKWHTRKSAKNGARNLLV
jgi:hypothetical protein